MLINLFETYIYLNLADDTHLLLSKIPVYSLSKETRSVLLYLANTNQTIEGPSCIFCETNPFSESHKYQWYMCNTVQATIYMRLILLFMCQT